MIGVVVLAATAMAQKARKLPEGAYIKTAKIEILSGDQERYKTAVAMLDSLFLNYGPHAEGLYLMAQIMVDGIKVSSDPKTKGPYVAKLVSYRDSLKMCCESKTVKEKYKEGCSKFIPLLDSIVVLHWRQFYNDGVAQLNSAEEALKSLESEKDSTARDFDQKKINATLDTCMGNMMLGITLDSTDYRTYAALGSVYEYKKDFESSVKWLEKSVQLNSNPGDLLLKIAYNYSQQKKFCEAISPFRRYLVLFPTDTNTLFNLSVSFARCGMLDSLVPTYHRLLNVSPGHYDALTGLGNYYSQEARYAADSSQRYKTANNEPEAKKWDMVKNQYFDSARVYFKQAFEGKTSDLFAAQQYGIVAYVLGKYEESLTPFKKLTELEPKNADNWTSVGDIYLNLKKFELATGAYEKVVELDPSNRQIWQRLSDLYGEMGKKDKQAEAGKHLK